MKAIGLIKTKIRSIKPVNYFICCIKRYREDEFVKYATHKSYTTIEIEGNQEIGNPKKIIYYIKVGNPYSGFGAHFRRTLDALFYADFHDMEPVVEYTSDFTYTEKEPINGTYNSFEYYFQQPSGLSVDDVNHRSYVLFKEEHRDLIKEKTVFGHAYDLSDDYISATTYILKKYIKLNVQTETYINKQIDSIMSDRRCYRYIGVHYRGTDFNIGLKDHPKIVSINEYLMAVDEIIEDNSENYRIFLATDDVEAIDAFSQQYGDRVVYYSDVFRSQGSQSAHHSISERKNHKYKLGLEIMRDILTLSTCDYLVAGLSNVSFCARLFKKASDKEFIQEKKLSNGIN